MAMNSRINTNAIGRVMVNSGSRGLFTAGVPLFDSGVLAAVNVRPQTRQRVALSFNRVPQVGHTLVLGGVFSGLIISLYMNNRGNPR